jgi:hypothetical protein
MKIPTWLKPGLIGAALGAVATMVIGFNQGGWYSNKSAEKLADDRSAVAVVGALVPVCLAQAKLDPQGIEKIKAMTTMVTSYERRDYLIKAGWATTSTADGPNRDVATACADTLIKPGQS